MFRALTLLARSCLAMKVLNLSYTRVWKAISEIKTMTQLSDLDLDCTRITPGAFNDICRSLIQLRRLKTNLFDNSKFTSVLPHLPDSLQNLQLDGLPPANYNEYFTHLTALERMDLKCWSEGSTFSVQNLKLLTRIRVDGDLWGTQGYDWSSMKYYKSWAVDSTLYTTSLQNCNVVEVNLLDRQQNLTNLTNLVSLRINNEYDVSEIVPKCVKTISNR